MIFRRDSQGARFKKWRICLVLFFGAVFIIVFGINLFIVSGGTGRVFKQISDLPQTDFGLVMGTDLMRFDGSTNIHFLNRTEGAAEIFLSGTALPNGVRSIMLENFSNNIFGNAFVFGKNWNCDLA